MVALPRLMAQTNGRRSTRVGLIDGMVQAAHPDLADAHLEFVGETSPASSSPNDTASRHATSVAGILVARRDSGAPSICPDITLLLRPIVPFAALDGGDAAGVDDLASAIVDLVDAGARVINVSLALRNWTDDRHLVLREALDYAYFRGVIIAAAAGNESAVGRSVVFGHRSAIPVVAYDAHGHATVRSNLGHSISRYGVGACASGIMSLGASGLRPFGGTSAAAAIVTGTIALLRSEYPSAGLPDLLYAVRQSGGARTSIVPPLLDAWAAYQILQTMRHGKEGRING